MDKKTLKRATEVSTKCLQFLAEQATDDDARHGVAAAAAGYLMASEIAAGLPAGRSKEGVRASLLGLINELWSSGADSMGAEVARLMLISLVNGDKTPPDLLAGLLSQLIKAANAPGAVDAAAKHFGLQSTEN